MQSKFARKTDPTVQLQPKYDSFIRFLFRALSEKIDHAQKIEEITHRYQEIAGKDIVRDIILIDRLSKLKQDIINNGQKYSHLFIDVLKLLKEAKIIYDDVFQELSIFPQKIEKPTDSLVEKYKIDVDALVEKVAQNKEVKGTIKGLIKSNIDSKDSIRKKLRCFELFQQQFNKEVDWTQLDPELRVQLECYGSLVSRSSVKSSDIDISLKTSKPIDERKVLQFLYDKLIIKFVNDTQNYKVQRLLHDNIRVPLIDLTILKYEVKLSFTVNNILGIYNSKMIDLYLDLDPRARILCLLVKIWAKIQGVISTQKLFLSSYAYNLMVINYLQTISPPILPSLQKLTERNPPQLLEILRKGKNFEQFQTRIDYESDRERLQQIMQQNYSSNTSDIIELLLGFFKTYGSASKSDVRISVKEGTTLKKRESDSNYLYSIEDPFDPYHNPGKYLLKGTPSAKKMLKVMFQSYELLKQGKLKEIFLPFFA